VYEVELKLPADHDTVRERLHEAGATPRGTVVQVDTYYDAPHREFAETDEALRVREETTGATSVDGETATGDDEPTVELTYKGPLVGSASKTREERETAVTDGEAVSAILEELGFTPAVTVEKERERFELDGYTVALDEVRELGAFVEVETEADTVEPAREGAERILRELDLDPDDQLRTSYLELQIDARE
jgi:adenylate cyclase class 2